MAYSWAAALFRAMSRKRTTTIRSLATAPPPHKIRSVNQTSADSGRRRRFTDLYKRPTIKRKQNKMLKEQKNQKIELSQEQAHPNTALAEDFHVGTAADNVNGKVPGCFGDLSDAQYATLLRESGEARSTKPPLTGKSGLAGHPKRK
jgi:carboxylesterase type B